MALLAQSITNSPYTQYGYGELSDPSFGAQRAMGGIGYGLREANIINPLNPASFSKVDSMTFMFDIAVTAQRSWFDDGISRSNHTNAKLDYVALQFPLYKNLGMGIGLKPVSQVGYKMGKTYPDSVVTYSGSGGLNQVYGAFSYNFKNLSVGVNVGYLFGNIYRQGNATFSDPNTYPTIEADTLSASGLVLDIGIQYTYQLENDQRIVLGAVYTPKLSTNGKHSGSELTYNPSTGKVQTVVPMKPGGEGYEMPETYAVGLSYVKGDKFLGGVDYTYQKWSDVKFEGSTGRFNNRTKINVGGEFTPNARGGAYFGRVRYRLGGNYANSYFSPVTAIDRKSHRFNEYSISCGFGFPLVDRRSSLNLAFEYTKVKPKQKVTGLIDEQYLRFTVSYTFNELWFFQRKLQ